MRLTSVANFVQRPNGRRGLSLVELLVVVAIIAMLLATVLPSLAAARENTRRTTCAANLRTIAQGWHVYLEDHDAFPVDLGEHGTTSLEFRYGGKDDRKSSRPTAFPSRPINAYVGANEDDPFTTQMFACPSDRGLQGVGHGLAKDCTAYDSLGNSYPLNAQLLMGRNGDTLPPGLTLEDVTAPASLVVLAGDFMMRGRGQPNWPYHGFWHDGLDRKLNLAFLDGHADFVQLQPGSDDTGWYRFHVRW